MGSVFGGGVFAGNVFAGGLWASQQGGTSYPLDGLSLQPVLAYSTRRLRSAYTGPLAEWRRASDSAVTDVSGDSITSSSPVSAGGTLGTWVSGTDGFYRTWHNQGTDRKSVV